MKVPFDEPRSLRTKRRAPLSNVIAAWRRERNGLVGEDDVAGLPPEHGLRLLYVEHVAGHPLDAALADARIARDCRGPEDERPMLRRGRQPPPRPSRLQTLAPVVLPRASLDSSSLVSLPPSRSRRRYTPFVLERLMRTKEGAFPEPAPAPEAEIRRAMRACRGERYASSPMRTSPSSRPRSSCSVNG